MSLRHPHAPPAPQSAFVRISKVPLLTSFSDFALAQPIARALTEENYHTPTPIQAQTIPLALASRDVVGIAQTGTGKTAAFALPILQRLHDNPKPRAAKACRVLVLSPTRELSGQIADSFRAYGRHMRISATLAIGGVPIGRQKRALHDGVDVLVATPGRLLDLLHEKALSLSAVEVLVLDEADRMLDMGFIHDIRKVLRHLPRQRQTLFFSATMPQAIAELAADMLRDPARVTVTPVASTAERIAQRVIHVERAAKLGVLSELLQTEMMDRALVFTRTKHGADKVVRMLARDGIRSEAIHGNKSQNNRERTLGAFRSGALRILVATDIASRGIDVDGVSHVFNFDLPNIAESYVHRIGRTARAGAEGTAISLVDREEAAYLRDIERLIRMNIPATRHTGAVRPGQRASDPSVAELTVAVREFEEKTGRPLGEKRPPRHRRHRSAKGPRPGHDRAANGGGESQRGNHQPRRGEDRPAHAHSQRAKNGANHRGGSDRAKNDDRRHGRDERGGGHQIGGLNFMKPVTRRQP
jgi:ATP-dependent RNA helicase RhlE